MKKVRLLTTAAAAMPAAFAATIGIPQIPAFAAAPAYTQENCNGVATQNWVHLDTTNHGSVCIGGKGLDHPDLYVKSLCPGNNSGWFSGHYADGVYDFGIQIHPGLGWSQQFSPHFYLSKLSITGWHSNFTC
jgi:hypothetical protein